MSKVISFTYNDVLLHPYPILTLLSSPMGTTYAGRYKHKSVDEFYSTTRFY